ncbi:MAG: phosphatase PAP2 family protein [Acidobacteriaceae bacterium]
MNSSATTGRLSHTQGFRWNGLNWTDRIFTFWYVTLSLALLVVSTPAPTKYLLAHFLIIILIFTLAACSRIDRSWRFAHDWYPTLLFVFAFEEVARLSLIFVTHWQDALILRAEAAIFPISPNLWLARWDSPWMVEPLEFGYFTFYWIMLAVGGVLYGWIWNATSTREAEDPNQPFRVWMDATVLGYIICYIFFVLLPTEGPAHTLYRQSPSSTFTGPFHWLVRLIQHHAGVHGNAFPSSHIMASFVALLSAARWKPRLARWLVIPVVLMCIGAVYDGYHYASDIVAGALLGIVVFYFVSSIRRANPAGVA